MNLPCLKNLHGTTLIAAISGGPDSVFLLHQLQLNAAKNDLQIIVAHFNHLLRGPDSDRDQNFVKKIAASYQFPFESASDNVTAFAHKNGLNIEAAGRFLRYQFLEKIRQKHHANYVLTAHHQDDDLETLLMHLIRGTYLQGMHGLQEISQLNFQLPKAQSYQIPILRPLLNITKPQILAYLKQHRLSYRSDSSNQNKLFTRNRLRLELIPLLRKLNPQIRKALLTHKKACQEMNLFLKNRAQKWLTQNFQKQYFSVPDFYQLPLALQRQILQELYEQFYYSISPLSFAETSSLIDLISKNQTGLSRDFGKNLSLKILYQKCHFSKKTSKKPQTKSKQLQVPGITNFNSLQIKTEIIERRPQTILNSKTASLAIFIKKPKSAIYLRTWRPGDRIQPLGLKGTKKIQDVFSDLKIPQPQRSQIPLLATKDNTILAVSNLAISENAKVNPQTPQIIKITFHP